MFAFEVAVIAGVAMAAALFFLFGLPWLSHRAEDLKERRRYERRRKQHLKESGEDVASRIVGPRS